MKHIYPVLHIIIYTIFFVLLWLGINLILPFVVTILGYILGTDISLFGWDPVASAVRSTSGSWREYFLLKLAPVAIASYLSIKVLNILNINYNGRTLFYGFGILVSGFFIYTLIIMISVAELAGFGIFDYLIHVATPLTAIGALYFTIENE